MTGFKTTMLALATIALVIAPAAQSAEFPPGDFVFLWDDNLGYLIANEAHLLDVLEEISLLTEISIEGEVDEDALITADLRMKPLESIINAIAASSVITYTRYEDTDEFVVSSIVITPTGDPAQVASSARRHVIDQHNLSERLQTRQRRPVRYVGIGANVSMNEERTGVWLSPMSEEAPSYKAGIRMGDLAVAIDDRPVESFRHMGEIIRTIRMGGEGTSVSFTIRNPNGTQTTKTVQREQFHFDPRDNRQP